MNKNVPYWVVFLEQGVNLQPRWGDFSVSPPGTGDTQNLIHFWSPKHREGWLGEIFGSLFSRFRAIFGVKISPITKIFACVIFYIFVIDINEKLFS